MRKATIIITLSFMLGVFFGCDNVLKEDNKPNENGSTREKITIVANLTTSSGSGFEKYGEQVWNGLMLSKDTLEALGVNIIPTDNKGDQEVTKRNFDNYKNRKDVLLVLTNNSPLSKNARKTAEDTHINQIALVAGDVDLCFNNEENKPFQWVFRDAIMQNQEGKVFAPIILNNPNVKTIAMLGVSDDYGTEGMSYLEKEILKLKADVNVVKASFDKKTTDFNSIIDNQLSDHPDAFYFAGRTKWIIAYVNQLSKKLAKRGLHTPIYVCDAFDDEDVLAGLGDNAKGVVFASYYNNFDNPEWKDFLDKYHAAYDEKPGFLHRLLGRIFPRLFPNANQVIIHNPGIYAVDAYVCGQYIVTLISEGNRTAEEFNKAFETLTFDSPIKGRLKVVDHSVISNVAAYKINEKGVKELIYYPNQEETLEQ